MSGHHERKMAAANFSPMTRASCANGTKAELRFGSSPHFLHHDVLVIVGDQVVTGSTNFTRTFLEDRGGSANDENTLFIPDRLVAGKYATEFESLWAKAVPPDSKL